MAIKTIGLVTLLLSIGNFCHAQSVLGDWVGGYQLKGKLTAVLVHLKSEQQIVKGTFEIESADETKISVDLTKLNISGARVSFKMVKDSMALNFEGQVKGNRIKGKLKSDGVQSDFELLRILSMDPQKYRRYFGAYQVSPDQFISVGRFHVGDPREPRIPIEDRIWYADSFSGRNGFLVPLSETEFIIGPAIGVDYPADIRIKFISNRNGEVTGLKLLRGGVEKTAAKIKLIAEDVRFRNGDITLAGTLVLPSTTGPYPAVVFIHGSTQADRYYFGALPYDYAAHGIAAFVYDKRGCGESGGRYSDSLPIETLASDAVAGVEYLKTRSDIKPNQIGVNGHSQGGWVAPMAAVISHDVAFVMAGASSGWTTEDNNVHELDSDLRVAGFSDEDRARARALYKQGTQVALANGEGWNEWRDEINRDKNEKWFPFARTPPSLIPMNDENRVRILEWAARERGAMFDPVPVWERLTVPVVVYEGELDLMVPAVESASIIETALKKAGNKDYTIKVFPKANHGLWAIDPSKAGLSYRVEEQFLMNWLLHHVTVSR